MLTSLTRILLIKPIVPLFSISSHSLIPEIETVHALLTVSQRQIWQSSQLTMFTKDHSICSQQPGSHKQCQCSLKISPSPCTIKTPSNFNENTGKSDIKCNGKRRISAPTSRSATQNMRYASPHNP